MGNYSTTTLNFGNGASANNWTTNTPDPSMNANVAFYMDFNVNHASTVTSAIEFNGFYFTTNGETLTVTEAAFTMAASPISNAGP